MPTPPKARRARRGLVLRWTCTALTVLLLAAWTASMWYQVMWGRMTTRLQGTTVMAWRGTIAITRAAGLPVAERGTLVKSQWITNRIEPGWPEWLPQTKTQSMKGGVVVTATLLPLTPLLVAGLAATGALWWKHARVRHRPVWECASCGYDLTGVKSYFAPCPECGATPTPAPTAEVRG